LPIPLTVCPTCSHGIKQARGWTWIDVPGLVGNEQHERCTDDFPCPLCMAPAGMGKAGLLWIGEKFYKTPGEFAAEAGKLGISRRISTVPREFEAGKTWVLFAHPKATLCQPCGGSGLAPGVEIASRTKCEDCDGAGKVPAIFYVLQPSRVEVIVTETQSNDAEYIESLSKRKLTPVVVPDNDPDHQGTVYDPEPDELVDLGS